jgi:hypothetical protein
MALTQQVLAPIPQERIIKRERERAMLSMATREIKIKDTQGGKRKK